jgi:hypothetical protein
MFSARELEKCASDVAGYILVDKRSIWRVAVDVKSAMERFFAEVLDAVFQGN